MSTAIPIFLLLVLTQGGQQDVPQDTVHVVMNQAKKAEADFEIERALELWLAVIADDSITDGERFEANLRAGHLARTLERDAQARMHYLYVLRRSPTFQLPVETGPKLRGFFELVRQEVVREPPPGAAAPTETEPGHDAEQGPVDEPPEPPPVEEADEPPPPPTPPDDGQDAPPDWAVAVGLASAGLGVAILISGAVVGSIALTEDSIARYATESEEREAHEQTRNVWLLSTAALLGVGTVILVAGVGTAAWGLSENREGSSAR
ncbi:MAG: hypothetical protein ABIJ09_25760 [Pseudomonadota bacterium]